MKKINLSLFFSVLTALLLLSIACNRHAVKTAAPESIIVYPPPPAEPRIQYLTSFSTSIEFKGKQSAFKQFVFGDEKVLSIVKPYGIFIQKNKAYISDTGIQGLEIIDFKEETFKYFIPKGMGQLQLPINTAVDEDGNIYIADGNRKQVVIFDSDLNYLDAINPVGEKKPTDVHISENKLWVCALDDHGVQVFDKGSGQFVMEIKTNMPNSEAYLYQPANLTVGDSLILVSDIGACRVVSFDKNGTYINAFGQPGKDYGQFTRPKGIDVDREGNIYVVDAAFENIQVFNPKGDLLMSFGGPYTAAGGMYLPADVAIDYSNLEYFSKYVNSRFKLRHLIFVTNQFGPDKVSVYGFIEPAN